MIWKNHNGKLRFWIDGKEVAALSRSELSNLLLEISKAINEQNSEIPRAPSKSI